MMRLAGLVFLACIGSIHAQELPAPEDVAAMRRWLDSLPLPVPGRMSESDRSGSAEALPSETIPHHVPFPPSPPASVGIGADLDRLASELRDAGKAVRNGKSGVFVLVSLSLPVGTLEALAGQSAGAGAALVLRGLADGGLRGTAEAIGRISRAVDGKPAWMIDPLLFRAHDVNAVPAFVVVAGGESAVALGDVSLGYALDFLQRSHDGALHAVAVKALRKLADE